MSPKPLLSSTSRSFNRSMLIREIVLTVALLLTSAAVCLAQSGYDRDAFLPNPVRVVSTVPTTGAADVNPYGVAFIHDHFNAGSGPLKHGDILVSNFNGPANLQGTGTSIVRIPANGSPQTVFFRGTAPLGLSTALGVLQKGFVVVGNLPTADGTSATAKPGSLLVINNQGKLVQTITSQYIDGPWDMALVDRDGRAIAFIANALNGTITRLIFDVNTWGLTLRDAKTIGSGYAHQGDPAALFDAPTGLVYDDKHDVLYVASTLDNKVFGISEAIGRVDDAGVGSIVYEDDQHLHGALALAMAPNGDLLVSDNDVINSDPAQPSEIIEFTPDGRFVKELSVDPNQGGSFGLAVHPQKNGSAVFAAVDDNTASLIIWQITPQY